MKNEKYYTAGRKVEAYILDIVNAWEDEREEALELLYEMKECALFSREEVRTQRRKVRELSNKIQNTLDFWEELTSE